VFVKASSGATTAVLALVGALFFGALPPAALAVETSVPVQVAVVVPLSVNVGAAGILTATELATATAPGGYLQRVLSSVIDTSATLAIDPMVIASIRLLGEDAPASAVAWLNLLATATNDTFALTYADSDITVALQSGSGAVLTPKSFDFAIDPARFSDVASSVTPTPTPDETADPSARPALPTSTSLTAWNYTIPSLAWPIAGSATNADVASIVASGFKTTLLSSDNVERTSGSLAAATTAVGGLLVSDDDGSAQLGYALASQTDPNWIASIARLSARISAVGAISANPPTMVIAAGRGTLPNLDRLQESLTAIDALPAATLVGLGTVAQSTSTPAQVIDRPIRPSRIGLVAPMLQAELADDSFSSVAANPELISGERRIQLLASLAPQWNRYDGGWGTAINQFLAESVTLRDSVRVIESSEIIFAADRGLLPITVRNDLSQPVTVIINVRPRTPLLSIENTQFSLSIEPDSQRRALIPAESRANGVVELVVSITSVGGLSIGPATTVTTRVQAGWETPVTLTIGALVLLMFGFGLFRTIRKRRAARSVVPE